MNVLKKYIWLVDTLMRSGEKGLTMEQIGERWNDDDEMLDSGAFAKRSFHRHRKEVADLFGIEIESYGNGHEYRYRIADSGKNDYFRRWLMDSIAVNRIVMDSRDVAQYVSLETYHDTSLPTLLQALSERRLVSFTYSPYWKEAPSLCYNFKPHALKLFERRWYLIGRCHERQSYRFFALDRISDCELQDYIYQRDPQFNLEEMFDGAYGIIVDEKLSVESIWLKVDPYQANYLRSLPLHKSQQEIGEKDGWPVFSLRVRPTFDLKQKLLSFGKDVEVLKPESLREKMRKEIKAMAAIYC